MRVYITKYALTEGIIETDGDIYDKIPTMITVRLPKTSFDSNFHGNDWHNNVDVAKAHAEVIRTKKIASLRKQIAKLEAMSFANWHPALID